MSEQDNDRLLDRIKQELDESSEHLDAATLSRLTQIRSRALEAATKPKWSWQLPTLAMGSTAAVVAITISLTWTPAMMQQTSLEDLALLSANETFEMIDEVEFYQWLSDENYHG